MTPPVGNPAASTPSEQGPVAPLDDEETPSTEVAITDVRVLPTGARQLLAGERFRLEVRFTLGHSPPPLVPGVVSWFDVNVEAIDVGTARSAVVASDRIKAAAGDAERSVELLASGLGPGRYQFVTLVSLSAATDVAGFYDGPVITVR